MQAFPNSRSAFTDPDARLAPTESGYQSGSALGLCNLRNTIKYIHTHIHSHTYYGSPKGTEKEKMAENLLEMTENFLWNEGNEQSDP